MTNDTHGTIIQSCLARLDDLDTRAIDLSPADISSTIVEPVLSGMGWTISDPAQVRRPGFGSLLLYRDGIAAIRVDCLSLRSGVSQAIDPSTHDGGAEWMIVTNGRDWNIFHVDMPRRPFRSFSLRDTATAEDATRILELVTPEQFALDGLKKAILSETRDADILRALARHLDGSEALIDAIKEIVGEVRDIPRTDVKASLDRIEIRLPALETLPPAEEAPAPKAARPGKGKSSPVKAGASGRANAGSGKASKATATVLDSLATVPILPKDVSRKPALADLQWPEGTTHAMRRKHNYAFIRFRNRSEATTLLPGSVITPNPGNTLTKQQVALRREAERLGNIVLVDGMFVVMTPLSFPNPRQAATFAAGTLVKDMTVWKARDGTTLKDQVGAATPGEPETEGESVAA